MLEPIRKLLEHRRASATTGESDVALDPQVAHSRVTGGRETDHADSAATTGTGGNGSFVGRVTGETLGSSGETGAERRANAAIRPR
ncbi:hypothetical protein K1T35_41445 [Pseudonocardia sp. DSM 110487]|uniref:hypothetical protein n=1 Tax=Pseudonocardia sp. DSM 110487 TaxID=2865833 RepID=UPI001C696088|nr:hypothetical protein [Pseudonocardia sp. DSM 110487]QYN34774.1 hypothetical protein K1T35_41445 [Pseudonocardia sp. DSM 110487]